MLTYLLQGMILGFTAGISPGPMLGLVISQTLRHGWRAGNTVALAPLLTDVPIIVVMVLILGHLPFTALHWLSLLGGAFVIYLGLETIRTTTQDVAIQDKGDSHQARRVSLTAIMTNFLNPHPYLFWATVGSALLFQSYATGGIVASAAFVVSMYTFLVGTKMAIALLVSRSRGWLKGRTYRVL